MTCKHFEAIAEILASSRPDELDDQSNDPVEAAVSRQWVWTRDTMTHYLATINPNFDRERFIEATEK